VTTNKYHRDYNVILIEDCCGAYDNTEHAATLNNISKFFGIVTTSETLIATLQKVTG
jgi:nicotinamidase-related amidase